MKRIISILLAIVITIACLNITASADRSMSQLISEWFSAAIKYASADDYDSFATLYGDIETDIIERELEYFRDYVNRDKHKCRFNIVSTSPSGQVVVDVMFVRTTKYSNGKIDHDWQCVNMYFGTYKGKAVRIPSNYWLRSGYVKSNDPEYVKGFINNENWVKHGNALLSRAMPTIRYARLNDDASITVVISIINTHDKEVKDFTLFSSTKTPMINIAGVDIDVYNILSKVTVPANETKSYKIKIPASKYDDIIAAEDLSYFKFAFDYTYTCGDMDYKGNIASQFRGRVVI